FERCVDWQRLHRRLNDLLKQPRKVGLKDTRQLVFGLQCPPPWPQNRDHNRFEKRIDCLKQIE
ncbi:hypothetical protein, partial [Acetobacter sp. DmW_125123]|uniref:hypothetical protein n=1 Tax=Acetobacter sp. DmW_125123 TaxID=2591078 RepID=UPI0014076A78